MPPDPRNPLDAFHVLLKLAELLAKLDAGTEHPRGHPDREAFAVILEALCGEKPPTIH